MKQIPIPEPIADIGKAREEAIRKNLESAIEYANITRKLLVDQGEHVQRLANMVGTLQNQMKVMDDQLSAMQVKVYTGLVATSGD